MALRTRIGNALGLLAGAPTFANLWDYLAGLYGRRTFVHLDEPLDLGMRARELSYEDIRDTVSHLAGALAAAGVIAGDRVAICGENNFNYPLAIFAAARLGAIAVPLHHRLKPNEAARLVEQSSARTFIADPDVAGDIPGVTTLRTGPGGELADALARAEPVEPVSIDADAPVAILFTSGTTGRPKGATLTSKSLLSVVRLGTLVPNGANEVGVYGLPSAHIMGLSTLLCAAYSGCRLHWFGKFKGERVLDALVEHRATFFVGVPAMYAMLLAAGAESRDLTSVKLWVSGADAMPSHHVERFRAMGCALRSPLGRPLLTAAFAEIYGMVELSGPAILKLTPAIPAFELPNVQQARKQVRSAARGVLARMAIDLDPEPGVAGFGLPIPPYRARVVGEDGAEVQPGTVGELLIKGPGVTKGYDADPEATKKTTRDGWLNTGDLAKRSRLGRITFVARKKDVVKHGGYSVFPAEVETEMLEHPAITEAVVLGAPHPTKGQVPVAAVVVDGETTAGELAQWCRDNLASYRCPRAVAIVASGDIPRNANQKVLKDPLRDALHDRWKADFPEAFD